MTFEAKNLIYIFFGTGRFAEIVLTGLLQSGLKPAMVVTQPDKPVGREQLVTSSAVKQIALKNNLPFIQPASLKKSESFQAFFDLKPDLNIVADYGELIPLSIINLPHLKTVNIHPSLLPKYRGAAPIQAAILNGDTETGVSIMLMDEEMDHGPIVAISKMQLTDSKRHEELLEDLGRRGAELLINILSDYLEGKIKPVEQNHSLASYTKKITKEDGEIDFNRTAAQLDRMIRAYQPWPGAWFNSAVLHKTIKILAGQVINSFPVKANAGRDHVIIDNNQAILVCGDQTFLSVKRILVAGKKEMSGQEFAHGYGKYFK